VAVSAEGDSRVLPESSSDRHDIDSGSQELGGDVMPEIMEPDIELHAVAETVEAAGHGAGIAGHGPSHVGAEYKWVVDKVGAALERPLVLALVLLAEQIEGHGINRDLTDASLGLCPLEHNETSRPDAHNGRERDRSSRHVDR